jgi:hypothetical protein
VLLWHAFQAAVPQTIRGRSVGPKNAKRMKLETQGPPEGCGGGGIRGGVNGTHFSIAGSLVIVPGSVLDEQASEIS